MTKFGTTELFILILDMFAIIYQSPCCYVVTTSKIGLCFSLLGSYSILNATFTFQRRTGHSIIQIYIPTIAIVCVSWFSLWIDKNATAARIGKLVVECTYVKIFLSIVSKLDGNKTTNHKSFNFVSYQV